jgi:sugar fermentation stimulation protein A
MNGPGGDANILLPFAPNCRRCVLVRRVKRFSVECASIAGPFWAHTNNSGAMLGLLRPGARLLASPARNPARALPYTLELLEQNGMWVGVNTSIPNKLLREAFAGGLLPWAQGYTTFRAEVVRGKSRLDALLTGQGLPPLWVECKNVTLAEDGRAAFPDAVSERAHKHLVELSAIVSQGERAAVFYCVQRLDAACFGPAGYIDARYEELFHAAAQAGVESHPQIAPASPRGIALGPELPVRG